MKNGILLFFGAVVVLSTTAQTLFEAQLQLRLKGQDIINDKNAF